MSYTISQLSEEFHISTRTIRYYEELKLLNPIRTSSRRRVFSSKDYARIKLILRGKKFGFSLEEIKEMILLFDLDPTGKAQLEKTIEYGNARIDEIGKRISDLQNMKEEMELLIGVFQKRLDN